MSKRILNHLRSNVIGYLALFLTLSMGTAYATHKGGANTISSVDIIDGEVKNPDIGANAVTGDKVLNRSISFGDLAADSIFTGHIATGNVLSIDVRNNDLTGADVADTSSLGGVEINEDDLKAGGDVFGSLANVQLAPNAVDSSEIADSAVQGADIATASVDTDELAPSSVDGQKISDDAVDTADIKSGAVESSEIADDAVKAQEIDAAAVDSAEIAPNAVGTSEIGTLPAAIACCLQNRSVPSETPVVLGFDSALMNNGGVFDPLHPTRLTVPVAGLYHVSGSLYWEPDPSPSGFREIGFRCTCVFAGLQQEIIAHEREPAHGADTGAGLAQPGAQVTSASALVALNPGDYVEMLVYQNSGREQTISVSTAQNGPRFSLAWVAPTS